MKTWVRKTLSVGVLAAGALLFGPGVAHADVHQDSYHNNGILNGAQLVAPVSVPVNIVGNAIGVAGEASAVGVGQNITESGRVSQRSHDNNGIANGLQGYLPVNVPVNVVGNAAALLGQADAAGAGVNQTESAKVTEHGRRGWGQRSHDNNGILNGTQIYAPVDVPINICGNALSLLGAAHARAICANGHGDRIESAKQDSHHNNGILNGGQVYAPISLPVNVCGNAFGFLGGAHAAAFCSNGHGGVMGDHGHGHRHGHGGVMGDHGHRHGHGGVNGDHGHRHGHGQDCDAVNSGDHDRNLGDGAALGDNDDTKYGRNSRSMGGRAAAEPAEASPVSGLTQGVGAANLGGLDLPKIVG
jgi:hypothetical protein